MSTPAGGAPPLMAEHPPTQAAFLESSAVYRAALSAMATEQGWTSHSHDTFATLLAAVELGDVDVVILSYSDIADPAASFAQLLAVLHGPLVVLSESETGLTAALRAGATLVFRKPFDPELVSLGILALLRRSTPWRAMLGGGARVGDMLVHFADHSVARGGRTRVLSPSEWALFAFLMLHAGTTVSRNELARGAWGPAYAGRTAQVELYISRLRRKVERDRHRPEVIITVRGEGYRLAFMPQPEPPSSVDM